MCDQALQCLPSRECSFCGIHNVIDKSDTVQTPKLFKIDVSVLITVGVLDGDAKVRPIRVRLEDEYGAGHSLIVTCKKIESVLDSSIVYACWRS